jgi:hypothetical protein
VPSSCPLPQTREDVAIHVSKRVFAHHVPMIVSPTANFRVELIDQIGGRHAMCRFDDSSDALQEGSNILLGRLDEQFSNSFQVAVRLADNPPWDSENLMPVYGRLRHKKRLP